MISRSNPNVNAPNPAVRWFEWNGEHGLVRYYDKDAKKNVDVGAEFKFMLLAQLASVRGWHDASESGIYSNEVADTSKDVLVVKSFKGGTLAEGVYKAIKDRVHTLGGGFVANCYVAFKNGEKLAIGSLRIKGAALGAWLEFCKAHRADLYKKAIAINGFTEGKKGRIIFRVPKFSVVDLSAETNEAAVMLDHELQAWMTDYLSRTTKEQAQVQVDAPGESMNGPDLQDFREPDEDPIPF